MWSIQINSLAGNPAPWCPATIPDNIVEDFSGLEIERPKGMRYDTAISRQKIVDAIKDLNGDATLTKLAKHIPMNKCNLYSHLVRMKNAGIVDCCQLDNEFGGGYVNNWYLL
jgi:DNA-binding transcriptional ArsR family regulator